MEPDPENRVTLSREIDELGQPVPVVRSRCTELDRTSLTALHAVLGEELLAKTALGRWSQTSPQGHGQ